MIQRPANSSSLQLGPCIQEMGPQHGGSSSEGLETALEGDHLHSNLGCVTN